ncbi:MAG: hypothetical protein ACI4GZ_04465 [Ruminococcus sp.]
MNNTIKFSKLSKLLWIFAAAVMIAGLALLLIFGGGTAPSFTLANLELAVFIKALVAAVFVFALVLVFFLIRNKKQGLKMAIFSTVGAIVSAVAAFFLCIICRAPLGNFTFAVMLLSVALAYITFILLADSLSQKTQRRGKAQAESDSFDAAANKVFRLMAFVLALIAIIVACGFVVSLIMGANILALYALPTILTAVFSVIFTLAFPAKLYCDKL